MDYFSTLFDALKVILILECSACHTSAMDMHSASFINSDSGVQSQHVIDCGSGWIYADYADNLGCILFNTDISKYNLTWEQAQEECELMDGFLVEIEGEKAQQWLKSEIKFLETIVGKHSYWTGATDFGSEGNWIWIASRRAVNYTSWDNNRPNKTTHNHDDCVLLDCGESNSQCDWRDYTCNNGVWNDFTTSFICQKYGDEIVSTTVAPSTETINTITTTTSGASSTSTDDKEVCHENDDCQPPYPFCNSGVCQDSCTSDSQCVEVNNQNYCKNGKCFDATFF